MVMILSIIEQSSFEVVRDIKKKIESGQFSNIPDVYNYLYSNNNILDCLLQKYIVEVTDGIPPEELGIPLEIALMQACLNDTVLIGQDHHLYTNCVNEMLTSVGKEYQVRKNITLNANKEGKCRGYRLTKSKVTNMEENIGLVRTRTTFTEGIFWIYPVYRCFVEYILLYAKTYGVELKTKDWTAFFTFNDTINKRMGIVQKEMPCLESLDDIFSIHKIIEAKDRGYITMINEDGKAKKVDLLADLQVVPLGIEDTLCRLGNGEAGIIEQASIKRGIELYKPEEANKYQNIYTREVNYFLKNNKEIKKLYTKNTNKYKQVVEMNSMQDLYKWLTEKGDILVEYKNGKVDFYTNKADFTEYKKDLLDKIKTPEGKALLEDAESGGYSISNYIPFFFQNNLECLSTTDQQSYLVNEYSIYRCYGLC